eukprot:gnl/MRDRNA2_/MRDRNA2_49101_c0_seq1.p1 gnl/MRDRNA2_/MRDRNA2_49101_c0~~gnl/MRDRNA2_/MRDRNA2_49101_c0_seq1.p1  ORF type:complete len:136 (-),score=15.66 gnl/MRDRNA2_/MRDRNA2_49101_c0_seq1:64-471(-)
MWYDEIKLTSGGRVSSFSSGTGHYTQVVWKETTDLGCAVCGRLLNCQYGIGGNMGGQFNNNVNGPVKSSSQCPDGASGEGGQSPSPSVSPRPSPSSGGGGGALSGAKFIAGASSDQISACTTGSKRCILYFGADY